MTELFSNNGGKPMQKGNKVIFKRADAIAMTADRIKRLEKQLKEFEGVRLYRKCNDELERVRKNLGELKSEHAFIVASNQARIALFMTFTDLSDLNKPAILAAAIADAETEEKKMIEACNELMHKYKLFDKEVLKPSQYEILLESELANTKEQYAELQKNCSDTVTFSGYIMDMELYGGRLENADDAFSSQSNNIFR